MALSARQAIELFHLVFLRALVAKNEDRGLVSLKGGCNLRFYFASVRYSEDIDLDVVTISKSTLKNKVDRLLLSPMVTSPLAAKGITVVETSAPKQTETTQRWKAGLRIAGISVPVRTKIEISRRGAIEGAAFEGVERAALRPYGLPPFLATHYAAHAAITQKVHALAGRAEPQARDVFDLNLLLAREDAAGLALTDTERGWVPEAVDRAMSVSFDDYVSKVVAYLEPEQAELFSGRDAWNAMQEEVVTRLEALR
jgi:predicted nucleotidyltransferase component of viral defense system